MREYWEKRPHIDSCIVLTLLYFFSKEQHIFSKKPKILCSVVLPVYMFDLIRKILML